MDEEPKDGGDVVDLERAVEKRKLNRVTHELNSLAASLTGTIAEIIDLYHQWEHENPDQCVRPLHKMEMVAFGFVGMAGIGRCREEHRVPSHEFWGEAAHREVHWLSSWDPEVLENIMCPAKESRKCQGVWEEMGRPPCLLLTGEIHQAVAPQCLAGDVDATVLDHGVPGDVAACRDEFERAERLIREYEEREEEAANQPRKC